MKKKSAVLFTMLAMLPGMAFASIPYRVEQIDMPVEQSISGQDDQALARLRRFYVGGAYNFSIWNNGADDMVSISGDTTSSFDIVAGVRAFDIFRIEANYIRTSAKWNAFELTGDTAMINAILDARIGNLYRLFYKQRLVPYVGIGAGVSWNSVDGTSIENKITPVISAMAGLSVELGQYFALDFGYKYIYMFSPKFDAISDFAPIAHQFRVGARIHF